MENTAAQGDGVIVTIRERVVRLEAVADGVARRLDVIEASQARTEQKLDALTNLVSQHAGAQRAFIHIVDAIKVLGGASLGAALAHWLSGATTNR